MAFKFRLETSLRLAKQELDIAQGLLAEELRKLQKARGQRDNQTEILVQAFQGQKMACLEKPRDLSLWQQYSLEQKDKLIKYIKIVEEQEEIVIEYRERLVECRIKVEKFKRLKEKKMRLFYIQELKKEQTVIDEIAQNRTGRK
jgi:flagellar FliJ protein